MAAKPSADDKPYQALMWRAFSLVGELSYAIKVEGKSAYIYGPLSWIDQIEAYDALMNYESTGGQHHAAKRDCSKNN